MVDLQALMTDLSAAGIASRVHLAGTEHEWLAVFGGSVSPRMSVMPDGQVGMSASGNLNWTALDIIRKHVNGSGS